MKTEGRYKLRLYVTSAGARSSRAIVNVRRICEENLYGHYELDIVDIALHPQVARTEQLVAAPTLIKLLPLPVRRFVGDMSQTARILSGLDVTAERKVAEG
ncbi:MAG: circadian clock KaiB family protein [Planctomycetota bacterium]